MIKKILLVFIVAVGIAVASNWAIYFYATKTIEEGQEKIIYEHGLRLATTLSKQIENKLNLLSKDVNQLTAILASTKRKDIKQWLMKAFFKNECLACSRIILFAKRKNGYVVNANATNDLIPEVRKIFASDSESIKLKFKRMQKLYKEGQTDTANNGDYKTYFSRISYSKKDAQAVTLPLFTLMAEPKIGKYKKGKFFVITDFMQDFFADVLKITGASKSKVLFLDMHDKVIVDDIGKDVGLELKFVSKEDSKILLAQINNKKFSGVLVSIKGRELKVFVGASEDDIGKALHKTMKYFITKMLLLSVVIIAFIVFLFIFKEILLRKSSDNKKNNLGMKLGSKKDLSNMNSIGENQVSNAAGSIELSSSINMNNSSMPKASGTQFKTNVNNNVSPDIMSANSSNVSSGGELKATKKNLPPKPTKPAPKSPPLKPQMKTSQHVVDKLPEVDENKMGVKLPNLPSAAGSTPSDMLHDDGVILPGTEDSNTFEEPSISIHTDRDNNVDIKEKIRNDVLKEPGFLEEEFDRGDALELKSESEEIELAEAKIFEEKDMQQSTFNQDEVDIQDMKTEIILGSGQDSQEGNKNFDHMSASTDNSELHKLAENVKSSMNSVKGTGLDDEVVQEGNLSLSKEEEPAIGRFKMQTEEDKANKNLKGVEVPRPKIKKKDE